MSASLERFTLSFFHNISLACFFRALRFLRALCDPDPKSFPSFARTSAEEFRQDTQIVSCLTTIAADYADLLSADPICLASSHYKNLYCAGTRTANGSLASRAANPSYLPI